MKHKNIILVILFATLSNSLSAQKQNLKKYYSNIWKAEQFLLEDNYKKAAKHYKIAFKNKDWAFNNDFENAIYCNQKANIKDNMFIDTKKRDLDWSTIEVVREIFSNDQKVRQNDTLYDRSLQKDTIAFNNIIRRMNIQDSLNLIQFKELMKNVNVFDESIINYDELSTLFNHWLTGDEDSTIQNYFLPIALQAVYAGTLHPFHYVDIASIRAWRINAIGTISDYGMNYLTIYKKNIENCNNNCIYLAFSYNQNNKEWLQKVNKNRAKIYLENAEKQTIRDFLLWEKRYNHGKQSPIDNFCPTPQFIKTVSEKYFKAILEEINKNSNLDYFLTNEHNFNIK